MHLQSIYRAPSSENFPVLYMGGYHYPPVTGGETEAWSTSGVNGRQGSNFNGTYSQSLLGLLARGITVLRVRTRHHFPTHLSPSLLRGITCCPLPCSEMGCAEESCPAGLITHILCTTYLEQGHRMSAPEG